MKKRRKLECIDSTIGQETQLAVLGTTERALYTVQSIRKVLHCDALQKEPESYGSVWKLREAGRMYRPELDGTRQKGVEYAGSYSIVQGPGSVNPYSYPCRHVRASDLWCRRQSDVRGSVENIWHILPYLYIRNIISWHYLHYYICRYPRITSRLSVYINPPDPRSNASAVYSHL